MCSRHSLTASLPPKYQLLVLPTPLPTPPLGSSLAGCKCLCGYLFFNHILPFSFILIMYYYRAIYEKLFVVHVST